MSRATVDGGVDRYIAMPAPALGYQIGNLRFRELRARAEQRLGTGSSCGRITTSQWGRGR
jgi:uncharacterized protein (DUF885 family)